MEYTRLLKRQLRKYFPHDEIPINMHAFLEAVNDSYLHAERDRELIERSMEISSEELMDKNKALVKSNAALDEFVYRVSHDLKVPANNIKSMIILLRYKNIVSDSLGEEILDRLEKATNTLDNTINDVLDMTRIEKIQTENNVINRLPDVINEVMQLFNDQIEMTKSTICLDLDKEDIVFFQEENLKSIIRNLISNAIKYRDLKKENRITISSSKNAEYICLSFADNGIGIDLDKNGKRLFDMFSRFNSNIEGTGVGLYIVKKVIESQEGKIEVKSALGEGTTFTLYFKK